ncbi:hypothetical protein [Bradyrhizobium iriomotense]|uniref:hypothetical protein n=1 Tax=Bradyrhizobium iriomotense TaxID=441950 RepID=UPI0024E11080|nr:hypothetical protein [Bradyrhizobium iriomotense]
MIAQHCSLIVRTEQPALLQDRHDELDEILETLVEIWPRDVKTSAACSSSQSWSVSAMRSAEPHNTQWPRAAAVRLQRSRKAMFSRRPLAIMTLAKL